MFGKLPMNFFTSPAGMSQAVSRIMGMGQPQAPIQQQRPQAPMAQAPQPAFQNDFVYKRPTFGMQRQMTDRPSMSWRLGN